MKDKWKGKIKLDEIDIKKIIIYVLVAMMCIVMIIITKNHVYFLVAELEIAIAIQIYCDAKLLKAKDAIIELKDEEIEHKNDLIKTLLMRESRK